MRKFVTAAAAAAVGLTALMASSVGASAAVACNNEGQCWHVRANYAYRPEFGVVVHPNNWRWGANDHYVWREHTGRGYWRNGVWIKF
jgi:hypothetical protein